MKVIYTLTLTFLFTIFLSVVQSEQAYAALKEIQADHTFTVKFSKDVNLADAKQHIHIRSTSDVDDQPIALTFAYGDNEKTLKIKPTVSLKVYETYLLKVDKEMKSKSGKTLKQGAEQKFDVRPVVKTLAPVRKELATYLQTYKHAETNDMLIYGGANVSQETLDGFTTVFYDIQNYYKTLFPTISTSTVKPTAVVLGNDADMQAYEQNGGYVSASASGWISGKDNVIVMKKDQVNQILLAHEYIHWMYNNIYDVNVPLWINEASAFTYSWSYYEKQQKPSKISIIRTYLQNIYEANVDENQLYTSYSTESLAAVPMIFEQFGIDSFHDVLIDAKTSSFEQAWKKHYGVNFEQTKSYISKARDFYENYLTLNGYDLEGLKAYNAQHSAFMPVAANAQYVELQLFGKYKLYDTEMYRIYASSSVPASVIESVRQFSDTLSVTHHPKSRPLIVLLSPEESAALAKVNGKEKVDGHNYLKSTFVFSITNNSQFYQARKDFVDKLMTNYE